MTHPHRNIPVDDPGKRNAQTPMELKMARELCQRSVVDQENRSPLGQVPRYEGLILMHLHAHSFTRDLISVLIYSVSILDNYWHPSFANHCNQQMKDVSRHAWHKFLQLMCIFLPCPENLIFLGVHVMQTPMKPLSFRKIRSHRHSLKFNPMAKKDMISVEITMMKMISHRLMIRHKSCQVYVCLPHG